MFEDITLTHIHVNHNYSSHSVDQRPTHVQNIGMERLAKLRKAAGLTQAQLAELADAEQATISRLENGTVGASLEMLEKIAAAMNVSVAQFFDPPPQYQRVIDAIDALPSEQRESAIRSLEAVSEALRAAPRAK